MPRKKTPAQPVTQVIQRVRDLVPEFGPVADLAVLGYQVTLVLEQLGYELRRRRQPPAAELPGPPGGGAEDL